MNKIRGQKNPKYLTCQKKKKGRKQEKENEKI
jgi:hypothetical protein